MIFRIFIGLAVLIAGYFGFLVVQTMWVKHSAMKLESGYAFTHEEADLTVVEFLDYSCPHCQQMHPVITEALSRDGHVNYAVRPMLSVTEDGMLASKAVYAAGLQERFLDAHLYMIENFEEIKGDMVSALATYLELDYERLKKDIESQEVMDALEKNTEILQHLGGRSIPAFLIGKDMLLQVSDPIPNADNFVNFFATARQN